MSSDTAPQTFTAVACPFCGIHCDDLQVKATGTTLEINNTSCPKAVAGFERKLPTNLRPQIAGKPASLEDAISKTVSIIKKSATPLFSGLGTDVAGARSIMQIADKVGGTVDHASGEGIMRNVLALSDKGWVMTTLTEIRNRADLIIFAGTDASEHPRFHERILWTKEAMFVDPAEREIVYLGKKLSTRPGISPSGKKPLNIACDIPELSNVVNTLKALLDGSPIQAKKAGGAKVSDLKKLAEKIKVAKYGVIIWSPPKLDFPHAELAIGAIGDLVRKVTETQRFSGFSFGGDEGATSASAVCTWQAGYPLRTSFAKGYPDYNPGRFSTREMLSSGQADALIWVSSFTSNGLPPETTLPTIVLGEAGMTHKDQPDIFIPVGTPGIDHKGKMIRVDNVVTLPMQQLRETGLPSVADVFEKIYQQL